MRSTVGCLQRPSMLFLSERQVQACLSMRECLEANRKALMAVASGEARVPTRLGLPYLAPPSPGSTTAAAADWTLFKPAALVQEKGDLAHTRHMGLKLVSIRAQNPSQHGLPLVPATILSVEVETGQVQAVVAATYLTAARTAAGSALSTLLVKPNPGDIQRVTVFGAGLQARLHLQALATAMAPKPEDQETLHYPRLQVTLVNRTLGNAEKLKAELVAEGETNEWTRVVDIQNIAVVALSDVEAISESLAETDVVIAATNTTTPLFDGSWLRPGTHICGVGSYTPDMQEIAARAVDRCRVLIDTPDARSVGDLKHLTERHPVTLLGTALAAPDNPAGWFAASPQQQDHCDCTFFKSVGTAIQDVLTADLVVAKARQIGVGSEVDMT